ncbi:MAG: S8 family serine peptidase [Rudaea sp.]|nr:S8 family serine peptidase [Rudaea sp.]
MRSRILRLRPLAASVAVLVAAAGLSANVTFASSPVYTDDSGHLGPDTRVGLANVGTARYIVRFTEAPLALYNSVAASRPIAGVSSIPTKTMKNGRARLDVKSTQAVSYVNYLKGQQQQHLSDISTALKQPVVPRYSMQYALNAVVVELTGDQAATVRKLPGVVAVERDLPHPLATDIGPGFIGAASVWWGTPAGQDTLFASGFDNSGGFFGDGIVIGDIDTGYNSMSPSFQPTDGKGYTVQNPLGAGVHLGQCSVAGISLAGCNDKVIGVYDEIDLTNSGGPFTSYSVEDTQGHGSHTASTAAGDYRSATLAGYTANVSGVAPHANLVIYYACSPDPAVECSTAATTASVDQAIQDGVVDALNYSISGGTDPWNDSTSLAFLSAANAGIFVAAAAGNTGTSVPNQVAGTANHWEPWVTTVAAGTHTGGAIAPNLSLTGPGTPPSNVQNLPLTEGVTDTPPTATVSATMNLSPLFHNSNTSGNDACSAFSAGQFTGAIALVSRGTCTFSTKVANAVAAGAVAVIISDNRPEAPLTASLVPTATVPVYTVTQAQGTALQTFLAANSNSAPAVIPYPPIRQPTQPDVLANFSLLGPVGIDVIKPDVQGPGVNILASIANDGSPNGPNLVALYNGTSMATPHTTGSGALMLGLHPTWTPLEAKSALMMTAKESGLTKANGVTPSDYFDRGSGRLQDFPASTAGLVLDENALNFDYANPAAGGDPSTLNLASMQGFSCINSCSFTRTFTATANETVTWTVSLTGEVGALATPDTTSFGISAGNTQTINLSIDSSGLASDGSIHFGEMTLTPSDATLATLHLPIAISVPEPTIAAQPNPLSITGVGVTSANATLVVRNIGGPTLNVDQDGATTDIGYVWSDQPTPNTYGYTSTQYAGREAGATDFFASDDFTITGSSPINLSVIYVPGFAQPNGLASFGQNLQIHWRIYSDANGQPSGNPDNGSALWSFDGTASSAGVYIGAVQFPDDIYLDVVGAGAPPTALPAGHYWLVVYPTFPCLGAGAGCTTGQWYWLTSSTGSGSSAVSIAPQSTSPAWTPIDPSTGAGLSMYLQSEVTCVVPAWLSQVGLPTAIAGLSSSNVTVTATGPLPSTSATGYLCLSSNDPNTPDLPVQVNAAQ